MVKLSEDVLDNGSHYAKSMRQVKANFTPLSPLSFLRKTAAIYPQRIAIVHGDLHQTWKETDKRCRCLASALRRHGVTTGDTVSIMAPNIPAMYEAHFGVPMTGAVLNTLNTRLDAEAIAFQLSHCETKVLMVDKEFGATIKKAVGLLSYPPIVIDIEDPQYQGGEIIGELSYEELLLSGDSDEQWCLPVDELNPISLGYTSGTTGDPKGVITNHRGAYLNTLSQIISWEMQCGPIYLWTLPMFHCNGWCFPWAVAAMAGTNICLRNIDPQKVLKIIDKYKVTHLCGAPIVYNMLIEEAIKQGLKFNSVVQGFIAGASPSTTTIKNGLKVGFDITHVYGLTEVYGPASVCIKHPEWSKLSIEEQARLNARQGVASLLQEDMVVMDPEKMIPVPADGKTVGEIMFKGNITMSGYLKNHAASDEAFAGGWFHTGDLAFVESDGYVRITDRSKDVIISGGENISSLEVEEVLHRHPAVGLAAVVAKPDEKWGEVPCAFIELRSGSDVDASALRQHCRQNMARYKVPKAFVFGMIPKTSTGKVQKFSLRELARSLDNPQTSD